jgi:hypothetical protein
MFYQADKIDNLLNCCVCEQKMVDPRIFPCGKSMCDRCVDFLADTEKKRVKCEHCAKIHEIPVEGFPKNLALQELLEFEAKEVFQDQKIGEFKSLLDRLESMAKNVDLTLRTGDARIREQCDRVRNDMQLGIEQAHMKLDEFHKAFMDEIDEYEKKCQENFQVTQLDKAEIEKALSESNEFILKSNQYLKQFQLDKTELITQLDQGHVLSMDFEAIKDKLERHLFNECLLKFDKTCFQSSSIGKISKQNIQLHFLENIGNIRELNLETTVNDFRFRGCFPVLRSFKSNNFLLLYNNGNSLNLVCLDRDGKTLYQKKNLIKSNKIEEFYEIDILISSNKHIFIYSEEKHSGQGNKIFKLRSFDENLNFLAITKLANDPNPIWSNDKIKINGENLFVLNQNQAFRTIFVYNSNLEIVQRFGQSDQSLPFFFPYLIDYFLVSDKFFIMLELQEENEDDSKIIVINRMNGHIHATFIIREFFDMMHLYLDEFILTFDSNSNFIKIYSVEGNFLGQKKLNDNMETPFSTLNKEVCFWQAERESGKFFIF